MSQTRAILCALAAFFLWVLADTCIKLASEAALSPLMTLAAMGLVGAAGMAGIAFYRGGLGLLVPKHPREQAFIGLCSLVALFGTIVALKHLPLTIFYIVVFTAPMAIAALSSLFKHEALTRGKIACLVAGFLGVVLAVAPQGGGGGEWIGYVSALVSVSAFAFYTVTIRKIAGSDSTESIQFICALAAFVAGALGSLGAAMPHGRGVLLMILAGILNLLGNLLYNVALNHTSSTNVAQIHYSQIVTGAFIAWLVWHEVPTWNLILGSLVIIASGVVVTARARQADFIPTP